MRNQDFLKMIEKLHRQEGDSKWKMWAALGIIGLTGLSVYLWTSGKRNRETISRQSKQIKDGSEAYREVVFKNSNLVQVNGQQEHTIIRQQREINTLLKRIGEIQGESKDLS